MYTIGIDFGTESGRALPVRIGDGRSVVKADPIVPHRLLLSRSEGGLDRLLAGGGVTIMLVAEERA
jgi:hypothetical protein